MSQTVTEPVAPLVEHFFRHEAGRLVSVLTRVFGWRNFDLVEETVQATLIQALQSWQTRGVPKNPSGWIHRVAKNKILDALRRDEIRQRVTRDWAMGRASQEDGIEDLFQESEIEDSQLRMIFACCHPILTRENQIALTLKTLCGFGDSEIARALLVNQETIKKRLQRAKQELIDRQVSLEPPEAEELAGRLDVVHQVLYLIFNEGYSSSRGEQAIRTDLCEEAARLCHLLCTHERCQTPASFALMALMLFHAARLDARLDAQGSVLLIEDQDRDKWDRRLIQRAEQFLDQSAEGTVVTPYHLEAGIALHHCRANSFAETNWPAIRRLYDALIRMDPSPIYLLNRAIVVAEIEGPRAGIEALQSAAEDESMSRYHLLDATLGELYRRAGDLPQARRHFEAAKQKTASPSDHDLINRRLAMCGDELKS
jgi:RNA polymerase sigma-70 factor (ECF subfamily)